MDGAAQGVKPTRCVHEGGAFTAAIGQRHWLRRRWEAERRPFGGSRHHSVRASRSGRCRGSAPQHAPAARTRAHYHPVRSPRPKDGIRTAQHGIRSRRRCGAHATGWRSACPDGGSAPASRSARWCAASWGGPNSLRSLGRHGQCRSPALGPRRCMDAAPDAGSLRVPVRPAVGHAHRTGDAGG
jgi:hypothetical protein